MKKFFCKILGHRWLYNFMSLPNKRICRRCALRQHFDYSDIYNNVWEEGFEREDKRTDNELIKKWVELF